MQEITVVHWIIALVAGAVMAGYVLWKNRKKDYHE